MKIARMTLPRPRRWMDAYTIGFAALCVLFVRDDVQLHYPLAWVAVGVLVWLLVLVGNTIYTFQCATAYIAKIWRAIFPMILLYLVSSCVMDEIKDPSDRPIAIVAAPIALALLWPALLANYLIGYGYRSQIAAAGS
jgi:hypothetical protein